MKLGVYNSFTIFVRENKIRFHSMIVNDKKTMADVLRIAGIEWKSMSSNEKEKWRLKALEERNMVKRKWALKLNYLDTVKSKNNDIDNYNDDDDYDGDDKVQREREKTRKTLKSFMRTNVITSETIDDCLKDKRLNARVSKINAFGAFLRLNRCKNMDLRSASSIWHRLPLDQRQVYFNITRDNRVYNVDLKQEFHTFIRSNSTSPVKDPKRISSFSIFYRDYRSSSAGGVGDGSNRVHKDHCSNDLKKAALLWRELSDEEKKKYKKKRDEYVISVEKNGGGDESVLKRIRRVLGNDFVNLKLWKQQQQQQQQQTSALQLDRHPCNEYQQFIKDNFHVNRNGKSPKEQMKQLATEWKARRKLIDSADIE